MSRAASVPEGTRSGKIAILSAYTVVFFLSLPGLLAAVGLRLDALLHLPELGGAWRGVGLGLAAAGTVGIVGTMVFLGRVGRGWPVSHLPPVGFVRTGPYALVRHPIYVAYTVTLVGAGLALRSPGVALGSGILLTCGWLIYVLGFEEPKLDRRFGGAYGQYRERVPLLPLPGGSLVRRMARRAWAAAGPAVDWLANRLVLFRIGPTVWVTYGAFMAAGTIAGLWLLAAPLLARGVPPVAAGRYVVLLALAMLIGGRLAWLGYQARRLVAEPVRVLRTVGFVSWGAIAVGIVVPFTEAAVMGVEPLWLMDCTLLGLAGCGMFGRLGCLTYGCCFGRESRVGVRWRHSEAKVNRVSIRGARASRQPRVPTQLIEAGWLGLVLLAAFGMIHREVPPGTVAGAVLLLYAVGRFAADCLREEGRFGSWHLTAGQIGSLASGGVGVVLFFVAGGPSTWPPGLPWVDVDAALQAGPSILIGGAVVFLATAFHWRDVGHW